MNQQQQPDHAPKVNAFRSFCMQIVEQLCGEYEREVLQMTQDIVRYRGELARCADLLAYQLGKEKQYHSMLENIAGNTSSLVGKAAEVGQKHTANDGMKIQMHQLLEQMFEGGKGAFAEGFGGLDEHRQIAETHLQTSAELQNQSAAIQKELDNILQALQVPPVSYSNAPIIMGPSMMQQSRPPVGQLAMPGSKPAIPGMVSNSPTGGFSPGPRSMSGSPFTSSGGFGGGLPQTPSGTAGIKTGRMGQMGQMA